MNKENSYALENQLSTQLNDTNSYSTRHRNKTHHKQDSKTHTNIIPYRYQRAAVIIQRFWRFRMAMQRKVYASLLQSIHHQNSLLMFQNSAIDQLTSVYEQDCHQIEQMYRKMAEKRVSRECEDCQLALKKFAGLTFKFTTRQVSSIKMSQLQEKTAYSQQMLRKLMMQRQRLRERLSEQIQAEEQDYLREIKQANMQLLKVSKKRNEYEKELKRTKIDICRRQIGLQKNIPN